MAAVLAVGGIAVYSRMDKGESSDAAVESTLSAVAVSASLPKVGELAVTGTYIGTVSPEELVNVIPLVSGEVTEVNYEVGDYVEAGSVLVRVDDEAARMQLQSAQLSKEAAQLNADRTLGSTMYSSNLSMVANMQGIESQIEMARKQYEAAGDSVEEAKKAKNDLQKALDTIHENVTKMESGYQDMQKMTASAKQLVGQDEYLRWQWKVDLLKKELESLKNNVSSQSEEAQSVSDNTVSGDPMTTDAAGIAMLEAQIAALEPATKQIMAMGYSAADIGEGRMDAAVSSYASQIATLRSQAATLESNIKSMDGTIKQAEMSQETTADTIEVYEDNLKTAQTQYFHQNNQALADNAAALQNQISSTEIGIASAQMQLENYVLTAPISGYIEQKNVADHGMVSAGNPAYVISNKNSMTITFYVSEAVRNQLSAGQSVLLERTDIQLPAQITEIGQSVDARTGLFMIKASVSESNLANGVTVQVQVATEKVTNAILVPYDAVYFEGDKAYVYCVENGVLVKTEVITGLADEDTIEIKEGLTADRMVVNSWSPQLADGVSVRLIEEAE